LNKSGKLLNQLKIADPSAAHGSEAFQDIKGMGPKAYPALREIVLNHKVSTDPLKWAVYLAAYLAPSDDEANAFVNKINSNSSFPDYVRVEASNGLHDRAMLARRDFLKLAAAGLVGSTISRVPLLGQGQQQNPMLVWMRNNVYPGIGMPKSFETPLKNATERERTAFWGPMGDNSVDGVVERMLTNDGDEIYDGALWQTSMAIAGGQDNLIAADVVTDTLNSGSFGELQTIRAWA